MNIESLKINLTNRGYEVNSFATAAEAAEYLDKNIDQTTVGVGGSVTIKEIGLIAMLEKHNVVYWHNDPKQVEEFGTAAVRNMAINTEVYLSSVNGMSESGEIINIDGTGNRISAISYGHKKVYLIVGKNKIELTFEKALWRARNIAAPKNAQRLSTNTPCAIRGDKCYNCSSPERICRGFLVLDRALTGMNTEVILVD